MAAPAIGDRLGKYLIEAELGRGGMGIVYRARHVSLDRTVALKIVLSGLTPDADDLKRFQREAQAIARLNHPNIVQVFDIEESHELTYLVMEFVAGENLDGLLKRTSISWKRMARIAADIAGALHFAHTKGVLHRDIKPANVLLSEDRQVKVADFGLAYLLDTEKGYTKTGILVGSPHYMSPEQCQGKKLDGRSDLYSLGVVLFRMLTGRLPFQAASSIHVLMKQISDPAPDPKELAPEIPEALAAITRRAMHKKPDDRFADMRAMRNALLEYLGEPPDDVRPSLETSASTATTSPMLSSPDSGETEVVTGGITLDVAPRSTSVRSQPAAVTVRTAEPVRTPEVPASSGAGEGTEFVSGLMALGIGPAPPNAQTARQRPPAEPVRPPDPVSASGPAVPRQPEAQPTPRKVAPQPRRVTPPPASRPSRNLLPWLLTIPIAIGAGILASKYVLTGGNTAEPAATQAGQNPATPVNPAPSPAAGAPATPEQAPAPTTGPESTAAPAAATPIATAAPAEIDTPAPGPTAPASALPAVPTVPAVAPTAPVAPPTSPAAAPTSLAVAPASPPKPAASPRSMEQTVELPFKGDRKRPAAANVFCFTESAQRYTFPSEGKNPGAASIRMHYEIEPAEPVAGDSVVVRALVANASGADFLVDRFEESDPSGASPLTSRALVKSVPPGQTLELLRFTVELKSTSDIRRSLKVFDGQQGVWTRSFQVAPCR